MTLLEKEAAETLVKNYERLLLKREAAVAEVNEIESKLASIRDTIVLFLTEEVDPQQP